MNTTTLTSAVSAQATQVSADWRAKRPAENRHADQRRDRDPAEPDDARIAERAADPEDDAQEIGGEARRQQVHPDADDDRIAAEDRRAIGEHERKDDRAAIAAATPASALWAK